ncbi:alpha/beta hydrolase [Pseudoduganella sp. SL102]|uniref:alpha/beta hydrolase n=1 Tax=Pseudoduganella sp. SL102 TaxID=2995154 RepID=UPI00248CDB40|nr:alpha/beta hydrolase [Pseudoduganella sp. SL102]WBS04744.1 alpha/beta hydrolase [Pseudoduganella sp. SL102]
MERRRFLSGSAALAAGPLWLGGPAAGQTAQDKIYLHYTRQELDDAYSDAKWAPNMRQLLAGQAAASARLRARLPPRTTGYGAASREQLDIFAPPGTAAGRAAMIFIHGGNWRFGSKETVSFLAPAFTEHGMVFIAPEFASIPDNTLPGMVDQCRRAIAWTGRHAAQFGIDPARLYVGGHSAGGHLAAMMLTTDWPRFGMPPDLLKGGLVLSGLCDLEPVVLAAGNRHLQLTPQERTEFSPVHKLRDVPCPVIVAWGSGDSPEFRRQGSVMASTLRTAGRLAGTFVLQDVNHFEILDVLAAGDSHLAAAARALMR